jgi:hypothetical protein
MWDIIFPATMWPESVYLGSYLDEAISMIRLFWEDR